MEETCPHLGAPLSHAEIEDIEDTRAIGEKFSRSEWASRTYGTFKSAHGINMILVCLITSLIMLTDLHCRLEGWFKL